jgi:hypothetical protein
MINEDISDQKPNIIDNLLYIKQIDVYFIYFKHHYFIFSIVINHIYEKYTFVIVYVWIWIQTEKKSPTKS